MGCAVLISTVHSLIAYKLLCSHWRVASHRYQVSLSPCLHKCCTHVITLRIHALNSVLNAIAMRLHSGNLRQVDVGWAVSDNIFL